jgi:hypothetical protein
VLIDPTVPRSCNRRSIAFNFQDIYLSIQRVSLFDCWYRGNDITGKYYYCTRAFIHPSARVENREISSLAEEDKEIVFTQNTHVLIGEREQTQKRERRSSNYKSIVIDDKKKR